MPLNEFKKGIDLIMNSTYFTFNDKFYKQIYGTAIGDSSSPIVCDIVFFDLENKILKSFGFEITYYGR